ncbi:unnamed protein product [Amoebophrya sp. A25]|nr:unnamed protein product [Amoebophrya sp. A25]|eukprot:GSA25T00019628001.1
MKQLPRYYTKGKFIGKGGFARCYEVTNTDTGELFAVKIVSKASIAKPRAQAKLRSEISIHRSLRHEKVVRFYDYYEDEEHVYIILEYCPNQTLNEFLRKRTSRRMAEPEAMFYIHDLILALKYLHKNRILHRDLKLGNLFLDASMRIKIGDFGLAAQLENDGEKRRTICGTPNYIAPEILEGKNGHSYEVDIWSLGVILYTMLIGKPPFETSDVKATYRKIRYNQYSFPEEVQISDSAKLLIQTLLQTDPAARPSLEEVANSKWMQQARIANGPPPIPPHLSEKRPNQNTNPNIQGTLMQAPSVSTTVGSNTNTHGAASGAPGLYYGGEVEQRRGANSRSETPDRAGALDFARLDSPAPRTDRYRQQDGGRYPMRERSPSMFTSPARAPSGGGGGINVNSHVDPPSTAKRNGRPPPLYQASNDENAMPSTSGGHYPALSSHSHYPTHTGAVAGMSPSMTGGHQQHHLVGSGMGGAVAHGSHMNTMNAPSGYHGVHHNVYHGHFPNNPSGAPPPNSYNQHATNLGLPPGGNAAPMQQHFVGGGVVGHQTAPGGMNLGGGPPPHQGGVSTSSSGNMMGAQHNVAGGMATMPHPGMVEQQQQYDRYGNSRQAVRPSSARPPIRGAMGGGSSSSTGHQYSSAGHLHGQPQGHAGYSSNAGAANGAPPMSGDAAHGSRQRANSSDTRARPMSARVAMSSSRGAPVSSARGEPPSTGLGDEHGPRKSSVMSSVRTPVGEKRRDEAQFASPAVFLDALGYRYSPTAGNAKEKPPVGGYKVPDHVMRPSDDTLPELWVTKWVDYSSKYGIGYVFSDNSIGVYFNDSTKIILESSTGVGFEYITRRTVTNPEQRSCHTLDDYPEDLRKKVTLLKHFKNYLLISGHSERRDNSQATLGESGLAAPQGYQSDTRNSSERAYVKKWMKNRHAIMFQLSNKIVQVIFFDKTEVVLSSKTHTVTYVDKRGVRSAYPLQSVMEISNTELAKRLRYTKDILVNLLSGSRATGTSGNGGRTDDSSAAMQLVGS